VEGLQLILVGLLGIAQRGLIRLQGGHSLLLRALGKFLCGAERNLRRADISLRRGNCGCGAALRSL
jgi:hypothetical protein